MNSNYNHIFQKIVFGFTMLVVLSVSGQEVARVDFTNTLQKIDGFGASSAWHGKLTDKEADVAFGNDENQLGLTILRLRIDPGGQSRWADEMANAKKAIDRGAIVFSSPWTPPASMKTNNNTVSGELKPTEYGNYVKFLNDHINYMANNNVQLSAISLQNEPNIAVTYESCDWTIGQMVDFCKNYAQDIKAPVIVPEAFNFDVAYTNALLNDSTAASHIAIIGGHLYGTTPQPVPNAAEMGKRVWMTEHYFNEEDILTCLKMAKEISDCMSFGMHAYIWWWLRQPSCNLITTNGNTILKKGYVMAQFSKFIRPGYYRTYVSYNQYAGMSITAYAGDQQVIVVVNRNTSNKTIQFEVNGNSMQYFSKYVTSATKNLSKEGTVEVINQLFTIELEPQSITTFVSTDESCDPTTITPYLKTNSGELQQTTNITVVSGNQVQLAPQPEIGGVWNWEGCGTKGETVVQTINPTESCEVIAIFTNECGVKSTIVYEVTVLPVTVDEKLLKEKVVIYPNPAINGRFNLKIDGLQEQFSLMLKVIDLGGRVLYESRIDNIDTPIEVNLKPSVYFVQLSSKSRIYNEKLIIR